LVNGVFLVALCMSIFLEAIQRLVEPQVVNNPKLVCIVGCFGLLSNILGLVLFHDHSHGHGDDGHAHGSEGDLDAAEQGYSDEQQSTPLMADQRGTVASIMPQNVVGVHRSDGPDVGERPQIPAGRPRRFTKTDETSSTVAEPVSSQGTKDREIHNRKPRPISGSHPRGFGSLDNIHVHPATRWQDIIAASRFDDEESQESEEDSQTGDGPARVSERSNLLGRKDRAANYTDESAAAMPKPQHLSDHDVHSAHNHAQPKKGDKKGHGHGHSHGDLNMKGVFLHVMGDALGNVGVIASALIIWLTDYSWRYYADPAISLIITVIILGSAIPLCKAASRILLQAVPAGMSIDHIKEDIERLPGVVGSHHLHVWQLSDTKLVASLHIKIDCEIKDEGSERYMRLARQVRKCLHAYGIHSSTIQPEFTTDSDYEGSQASLASRPGSGDGSSTNLPSGAASFRGEPSACLLECGDECVGRGQCCPAPKK
jgi:zinc transporter 1